MKKGLNQNSVESTLMKKPLIFMLKLLRYTIASLNQLNNQLKTNRHDFTNTFKIQVKNKLRLAKGILTCALTSISRWLMKNT